MGQEELSLVRFNVVNFFSILINSRPFQPTTTLLLKIVEALINCEPEPDEKVKRRIKWIYTHTHEKIDTSLAIIELVVFRNLDRGINKEIEVGEKTFYLAELYKYLDEISKELSNIVIETAKKYSLDVPMINFSSGKQVQTIGGE